MKASFVTFLLLLTSSTANAESLIPSEKVEVATILRDLGVSGLSSHFSGTLISELTQNFPATVSFEQALVEALNSFLFDNADSESPLALAESSVLNELRLDHCNQECRALAKIRLIGAMNSPRSQISLVRTGENTPPYESDSENWIFSLRLPNDEHGHWAIVDRQGRKPTFNYGFN